MKNFIFKSNESDLQKMFQTIDRIQKNVLYITFRVDKILKVATQLQVDKGLQLQVDQYFEDETSPQTDSDNKDESWVLLQLLILRIRFTNLLKDLQSDRKQAVSTTE